MQNLMCYACRDQQETKEKLVMMEMLVSQDQKDQEDHRDHEDPPDHLYVVTM